MKKIFIFILALSISIKAIAGDIKPKGYSLDEPSYVFTMYEARELKIHIEELEKDRELLFEYKLLSDNYEDEIEKKEEQLGLMQSQIDIRDAYINKQEKKKKLSPLAFAGYFILGAATATGFTILGNKVNQQK